MKAARAAIRRRRRLAVRQPDPVRRGRRPRAAYPRTEASDAAIAEGLGVDALFAPPRSELYPDGFATRIRVAGLGGVLEGAERGPEHFDGVCTVVCKLLNIVAARRRLLRPEGRAAGRRPAPDGPRPRHPGRDGDRPDRPRGRRPRALLPQRPPRAGRPRARHGAEPRAPRRRRRDRGRRARRGPGRRPRPRGAGRGRHRPRVPHRRRPRHARAARARRGRAPSSSWRPASGRHG